MDESSYSESLAFRGGERRERVATGTSVVLPQNSAGELTALVTGGAGFLGSHLVDRLRESGCRVICIDDFSTGSRSNLAHLSGDGRLVVIDRDVAEPWDGPVDLIFNLASPASPKQYQLDPLRTMRTSVLGAMNMLDLAVRRSARILQTSTSEVYGDPKVHPQGEEYWGNVNPIGPRACYDEGKRCAETLFFDYTRRYGTAIKVARIFNTYGPRMDPDDGRVISNFITQALRGDDITVYGSGDQTRSFCYVDDLVEGLLRLMGSPREVEGPINLGNPQEFTVRQLAEIVIDLTGSASRITHRPLPVDDPRQRRPIIERAEQLLDWRPTTGLVAGLKKTIAYFEHRLARSGEFAPRNVSRARYPVLAPVGEAVL